MQGRWRLAPTFCAAGEVIDFVLVTVYLRRTTSVAAGNGLCTTINYLRGAAAVGLGTALKYLRRTTSTAAGNGLGIAAQNERRRGQRPGQHDQVPAAQNKRRRGKRLGAAIKYL
jgi:hypothetical protein